MELRSFLKQWTPRLIAVAIGGYYGLGVAYDLGLMALIDKVAICVIKHYFGYGGIGALMPTVQWYSAWAARFAIGLTAGVLYDLIERCVGPNPSYWPTAVQ
ncbi:MAG: hypothetical protein WCF19_03170 [Chlamydiales bacterium]